MPYRSVAEARKKISSLQGMSTSEVKKFISIFNALIGEGMAESKAIPIAISRSKKDKKEVNKSLDMKDKLIAAILYLLNEVVGEEEEDDEDERYIPETEMEKGGIPVIKASNDEEQIATYVAYEPNVPDLHGEWMSEDTVRKACYSFNQHCMKANLFHRVMTDKIDVMESYIIPTDVYIGERLVRKGTWLMTLKYKDSGLWEMQKSGEIKGISIGARGRKKEPK